MEESIAARLALHSLILICHIQPKTPAYESYPATFIHSILLIFCTGDYLWIFSLFEFNSKNEEFPMVHTHTNEVFWPLEAKRHFYAFATFVLIMIYLYLKAFPLIKGFNSFTLFQPANSVCTGSDSLIVIDIKNKTATTSTTN